MGLCAYDYDGYFDLYERLDATYDRDAHCTIIVRKHVRCAHDASLSDIVPMFGQHK